MLTADGLRAEIDKILDGATPEYRGDRELASRVGVLIEEAYRDEPGKAEAVCARYREVFGADPAGVALAVAEEREPLEDIVGTGWFARYLAWTAEHEAPASYHFFSALAGVSAGVTRARRPLIGWTARDTYPNLYVLLVGPTGARKGSAVERAVRLTQTATGYTVLPGEGTHQGLAHALRRESQATGAATGLILSPEYSVLMKDDRNKSSLVEWLTDWWDSPAHWERALRGERQPYVLANLCPCMLGASNMAWLRSLPETAVTGGYMPRSLVVNEPGPRHRAWNPSFNPKVEQQLSLQLARAVAEIPETMDFSDASKVYIKNWYEHDLAREYATTDDEQFRAWLDRKQSQIMKVATLWQIVDRPGTQVVEIDWVQRAHRLMNWLDPSVRQTYAALGVAPAGAATADVAGFLKRRGATSRAMAVPKRDVVRALRNRYKAWQIQEALDALRMGGEAVRVTDEVLLEGPKWFLVL